MHDYLLFFLCYFSAKSHNLYKKAEKVVIYIMSSHKKTSPPRNPNKRLCVAKNITFPVQKENEDLARLLSKGPRFMNQNWLRQQ